MRGLVDRRLLTLMVLGFALGCADSSLAPEREDASVLPGGAPNLSIIVHTMSEDSTSADFSVTPTGGFFKMGKHVVYFPAYAICDPARSSYGPAEWDKPCAVLNAPIRVHAEVSSQDGREWVDFTPNLRFAPSAVPYRWVWIFLRTRAAGADAPGPSPVSILWSPAIGEPGVDESLTDRTLQTFTDPFSGYAYRRIKHFSGYNVAAGRAVSDDQGEDAGSSAGDELAS